MCFLEEQFSEGRPEGCREVGVQDGVDTRVGVGQHVGSYMKKWTVNFTKLLKDVSAKYLELEREGFNIQIGHQWLGVLTIYYSQNMPNIDR